MPYRLVISAIGLACVLLTGEALAQSASPWSAPAQLPETTDGPTGLVFGADGRGVLVFDGESRPELAVTDSAGSFRVRAFFRINEGVVPAVFGRHGVLLARRREGEIGQPVQLGVSIGDSSGRVGPVRRVARYHPGLPAFGSVVDVATAADGTAVLAWIEALPRSRARVRIAASCRTRVRGSARDRHVPAGGEPEAAAGTGRARARPHLRGGMGRATA